MKFTKKAIVNTATILGMRIDHDSKFIKLMVTQPHRDAVIISHSLPNIGHQFFESHLLFTSLYAIHSITDTTSSITSMGITKEDGFILQT